MKDLSNKTVLITGASSGIGAACAAQFAQMGARLILAARSEEKLKQRSASLAEEWGVEVLPLVMDVCDLGSVTAGLEGLSGPWRNIDVLVNNAGLALGFEKLQDGKVSDWEAMIDTNVKGLLYVTKTVLSLMVARNQGHVINIGSISAHQVYSGGTVYCATKFAVRAISEGIKLDVHGSPIRVTEIDPGMVDTNFSLNRFSQDAKKAEDVYQGLTPLQAEDIADAVIFCATRPAHVDIREMKIYPTDQTASYLVHRN